MATNNDRIPAHAHIAWPDSEGSLHVCAFFDAVASRDQRQIRTLVENHFAPGAAKSVEVEVAIHRFIDEQIGKFTVTDVELPTSNSLIVWGWSDQINAWMQFDFELEDTPSRRIRRADGKLSMPPRYSQIDVSVDMGLEQMANVARTAVDAPGLAIAVFRRGTLIERVAVGVRAAGSNNAIAIDDLFYIGSITKSMTATAIAHLVEAGVLSWSSRVGDYIRDSDAREEYRGVTLADLLHHRGGLAPFTSNEEFPADKIAAASTSFPMKRRAVTAEALRRAPLNVPGTSMAYSNAGYVIAAVISEVGSGETWEESLRDHLFEPWGLTSCGFGWPVTSYRRNQPHGHFGMPGRYRVQGPGDYPTADNMRGATGVHCTVADLGRYGACHLEGMRTGTPTIHARTVAWLHALPLDQDADATYAAGWVVTETAAGTRRDNHDGSSGTFVARLSLYPKSDLVVAMASNCGHAGPMFDKLESTIVSKWGGSVETP